MTALQIRSAGTGDLADLERIYNHYVTTTHITFDTEAFTLEQRRAWFDGFSESGPHRLLVAETEAGVVGYASSIRFRPKSAYHTSVETTVYLDPPHVGLGFGHRLYRALLEALAGEPAVHRAYGGIALPNPASIALHESLGFRRVGTFREVGHKFGKFWDVSWFEKELFRAGAREGSSAERPAHPASVSSSRELKPRSRVAWLGHRDVF